jgi:Glycosyl transferase family 2
MQERPARHAFRHCRRGTARMKRRIRTVTNYPLWQRPALVARWVLSRTLSFFGLRHPWVVPRPNPASPDVLDEFRFFAIVGAWMEEDVIEATVRNAFTQGCERVFLVDNDSLDGTVETAIAAGAELAESFTTASHDEHLRIRLMNEAVWRISTAEAVDHVWWLWLDADEFPHGPRGLTIRDYLATLDRSFRIVGARFFNHYPSSEPHYLPGFHPLDFQPLCEELSFRACRQWHRKHPLQRFDRERPWISSRTGIHGAYCDEQPLFEPIEAIFEHHFPFREKNTTVRRMRALFALPGEVGTPRIDPDEPDRGHMAMRARSLEAVYAQDWQKVPIELVGACRRPHVEPLPWQELVDPEHLPVQRWYPETEVERAGQVASSIAATPVVRARGPANRAR